MKKLWQFLGTIFFWVGWPALWLILRGSTRTRVIITTPDRQFLVVKGWIGSNKWILPGGGLHGTEEAIKGAIREVKEETNIQLSPEQFRLFDEGQASEYGLKFRYKAYEVRLTETPDIRQQRLELIDTMWMPLGDPKNLSPLTRRILQTWSASSSLLE